MPLDLKDESLNKKLLATQYDLVADSTKAIIKLTQLGAEKYDPDEWRAETAERHIRRAIKHALTHLEIRDGDREYDGEGHLSAAVCRMAMALSVDERNAEND